MERTTFYLVCTISEAQAAFFERWQFLRRFINQDEIVAYQGRADAIAEGYRRSVFHFAILRLSVSNAVVKHLVEDGQLDGARRSLASGSSLWVFQPSAIKVLESCGADLSMEIVPNRRAPDLD